MNWTQVSADRWEAEGGVSVRRCGCGCELWDLFIDGKQHVTSAYRKSAENCMRDAELFLKPISGSGPAKSMPERRQDGWRWCAEQMRLVADRIEVLAADANRDAGYAILEIGYDPDKGTTTITVRGTITGVGAGNWIVYVRAAGQQNDKGEMR